MTAHGRLDSVFDAWKSYEREIVPKAADAIQREECRRAFYAGARAMFTLVLVASDPDSEDECVANMAALEDELTAFVTDMRMT